MTVKDTAPRGRDIDALRAAIDGDVHAPGDPGRDAARIAFILTADQQPAMIAEPAGAADVATVVSFAREQGLRVAPQRTGHGALSLAPLGDAVLLKTNRLGEVSIDQAARSARVGAGALWSDVVPAAAKHDLAALHGSTPDVSVAGYTLGGGLGWYARKYGLAANRVTAIELIGADGDLVRADADNEPELFWALRGGGGGNFGVVTALELELLPVAAVYAGALFFALERSADVLDAWRAWTETAPEEVTSVGRIMRFPDLEDVPEPLRGGGFAIIEAVDLRGEPEAAASLAPLRELGPEMDTFATVPPDGIADLHMDPREPVPAATTHCLVGDMARDGIEALVAATGEGSGCTLISVELRHDGGAVSRPPAGAGAIAALPGTYMAFGVGIAADPQSTAKTRADLDRVDAALAPYSAGHCLNFVERRTDLASIFDSATIERLRRARRTYDPDGLFLANNPITA